MTEYKNTLYNNQTGLILFKEGDLLYFKDNYPSKEKLKDLQPLTFLKYNLDSVELCTTKDRYGNPFYVYREFLSLDRND